MNHDLKGIPLIIQSYIKRNHKTGFTIIEILIATTVFAILIAIIYGIFRHSNTTNMQLNAKIAFQSNCGKLAEHLRQDLSSAKTIVIKPHRIDIQRYSLGTEENDVSLENIIYTTTQTGILIERNKIKTFYDFDNIEKATDGTMVFSVESQLPSENETSETSIINYEVRIIPKHGNQLSSFIYKASITTRGKIQNQ
ncbi:MAG: prepilin-type N-terminal cleavage/methylation domain-containing protein [Massilibacteroides sp.]|nr:prepilin-type N-terminal cleavage/methylation domain-containing protein [Massilibacteroides sp.]MDD3063188.1 prepilin-type N-terminal cleavage/methylation domain-containing protein [Massilibacteroides sp.]